MSPCVRLCILVLAALHCAFSIQQLILSIGPETLDRPSGQWSYGLMNNGTTSRRQPFWSQTLGEDMLWCQRLRVPFPGMALYNFGIFMDTALAHMKLLLYKDVGRGYPQGAPLLKQTFDSVRGQNDFPITNFNYTVSQYPYGYAWLCALHGGINPPPSVSMFVANGTPGVDGLKQTWVYDQPLDYTWPNFTNGYSGWKLNVYIRGLSLGTWTPTLTQTTSPSTTGTMTRTLVQTPTATPTLTSSAVPTFPGTETPTATVVPTFDPQHYVYSTPPLPSEVLTVPWVDFYPHRAMVGEEITARVSGWHNFWEHDVYFKVGRGRGYDDCYGVQPGSEIQLMVKGTIKLRALKADVYRICYKVGVEWEPLERRFEVTSPQSTDVFWGYNSCHELLASESNSLRCGCFLGTTGERVHARDTYPLYLLLPRALEKTIEMGCCADTSVVRITVGTGVRDWGWCSNRADVQALGAQK